MTKQKALIDKWFRSGDAHRQLTLLQTPNTPIVVWFAATVISHLLTSNPWHTITSNIAFIALFAWAFLETFRGVNYFRRVLGIAVLIALFARAAGSY